MKLLVTGVKGQLGHDVMQELSKRGHIGIGVDIDEMDITDESSVDEVISKADVEGVVHCAAYTAVDRAEEEKDLCFKVNAQGSKNIAKACRKNNLKMMYISTDYVFAGNGQEPWKPEDETAPLNIYGQAKYQGEVETTSNVDKHFIIRTAWVFGKNGNNFIKTMLRLGKEKGEVSVVSDQVGSPTYTTDLAVLIVDMMETDKYGIYHATNEGFCSWYDFAVEIFKQAGMEVKVKPVSTDAFPVKAVRPHNSRLDKSKLSQNGFSRLPSWQDAVSRYLKEL
ncbi:MAG TPA: dTDP-4-dehydrorhamnose reductase [Lachnospiraceae bacterium]